MFNYILMKNIDDITAPGQLEYMSSKTVMKYLSMMAFVKFFEYKYTELGFFNNYIIVLIICDIIFSVYYFKCSMDKTRSKSNNQYNQDIRDIHDDQITDNFSIKKHQQDIDDMQSNFLKRKLTETHIQKPFTSKDAIDFNKLKELEVEVETEVEMEIKVSPEIIVLNDDIESINNLELIDE